MANRCSRLCRSPHGERGLKLSFQSLSWHLHQRRSPHGERGLKSLREYNSTLPSGSRSPHGERGLKSHLTNCLFSWIYMSLSTRRAWIEIKHTSNGGNREQVALHTESVDWNIFIPYLQTTSIGRSPHGERGLKSFSAIVSMSNKQSLSTRRAWIEILYKILYSIGVSVALHTESVDWNPYFFVVY